MVAPATTTPWFARKATSLPAIARAMRSPSASSSAEAVVLAIDGEAVHEAHRVLAQRRVERTVGRERQRGRIRRMHVQHHRVAGDAVDRAVDEEGGRLHAVPAGQHLAAHIDQHDVVGTDLAPVQAAGVDEVAVLCARQHHAEVVADAFRQAMVRGGAQRKREVFAQLAHARGGVLRIGAFRGGAGVRTVSCMVLGSFH